MIVMRIYKLFILAVSYYCDMKVTYLCEGKTMTELQNTSNTTETETMVTGEREHQSLIISKSIPGALTNHSDVIPRVVIVGAGFGGLRAARALRNAPVHVSVIDRQNHHLFQPLLYWVATAGLSPADICSPIRSILRKQKNTEVFMEEVTGIDFQEQRVLMRDRSVPYDYLVVATGAHVNYFGHPEWEHYAPALKSIVDATSIRRKMVYAAGITILGFVRLVTHPRVLEEPVAPQRALDFVAAWLVRPGVQIVAIDEHHDRRARARHERVVGEKAADGAGVAVQPFALAVGDGEAAGVIGAAAAREQAWCGHRPPRFRLEDLALDQRQVPAGEVGGGRIESAGGVQPAFGLARGALGIAERERSVTGRHRRRVGGRIPGVRDAGRCEEALCEQLPDRHAR